MSAPQHVLDWHEAIRHALPEPFEMNLINGLVPIVTVPPTQEDMYRFLKEVLPKLPGVRGGRMYAEGVVLEPALPPSPPGGFPYNEPEVMERYPAPSTPDTSEGTER